MNEVLYDAADEAATARLGAALTELLPDGAVIGLIGTLGAGKTRLVQAVAQAAGVDPTEVGSPTFVLINEYHGRRSIYHFDTYRLKDEDELLELGPEEYFASSGLTFVEWADRFPRCLPDDRLTIRIDVTGDTARRFAISGIGSSATIADRLRQKLASE